jgi:hypothetical protein
VILVEAGAQHIAVTDNSFHLIHQTEVSHSENVQGVSTVYSLAAETLIAGNRFTDNAFRAVFSTGDRSTITGNQFHRQRKGNVLWVNAYDANVTHNISGPLLESSSALANDAVFLLKKDGGIVLGNSIACPDQVQRGFLFYNNPVVATNNIVKACDPNRWFQWFSGQGAGTEQAHNIRRP